MYCPKCGKENADGSSFCQSCGESFAVPVQGSAPTQSTPPPYQGGPYQPLVQGQAPRIPSHLAWAIVSLLFFFLIGGIVAVVYASRVDSRLASGDVAGAQEASNKAKTWCVVSTVLFAVGVVIVAIARLAN
jgi:hypothetical protein